MSEPHGFGLIDDARRLIESVQRLYRRRITPEQAAGILRYLRGYDIEIILRAVADFQADWPDDTKPNWEHIRRLCQRNQHWRDRKRESQANWIATWWRSWGDAMPAWARCLLAAHEDGRASAEDLANWNEAWQAFYWWRFRASERPWRPKDGDPEMAVVSGYERPLDIAPSGSPPCWLSRAAILERAHSFVRALRCYGESCEEWKDAALMALERDAEAGGVETVLAHRRPEDETPW